MPLLSTKDGLGSFTSRIHVAADTTSQVAGKDYSTCLGLSFLTSKNGGAFHSGLCRGPQPHRGSLSPTGGVDGVYLMDPFHS